MTENTIQTAKSFSGLKYYGGGVIPPNSDFEQANN